MCVRPTISRFLFEKLLQENVAIASLALTGYAVSLKKTEGYINFSIDV